MNTKNVKALTQEIFESVKILNNFDFENSIDAELQKLLEDCTEELVELTKKLQKEVRNIEVKSEVS